MFVSKRKAVIVAMFFAGLGCGNRAPSTGPELPQIVPGDGTGGGIDGPGGEVLTVIPIGNGAPVDTILTAHAGHNRSVCLGGSVQIGPAPVAGFSYSWQPQSGLSDAAIAQPMARPRATTTYEVTVVDPFTRARGTSRVTVFVEPLPDARITGAPGFVCLGSAWTVSAAASSSPAPGPQSYQWQFGAQTSTEPTPTFMAEGGAAIIPVTLWVTDSAGCVGTVTELVQLMPLPIANAGADKSIGLGATTSIGQRATGGSAPYSYQWTAGGSCSGAPCISDPLAAEPIVAPSEDTRFTVQVTDRLGCVSTPSTVIVSVGAALLANAGPDVGICQTQTAAIGQPASGGSSPYSYAWTSSTCGAGCFGSTTAEKIFVTPAQTSVFVQQVTDRDGMVSFDSMTVEVSPHPGIAGAEDVVDPGSSILIGPTAVGASTYQWTCDRSVCALSDPALAQPLVAPMLSTRYQLSARNGFECREDSSKIVWVNLQQVSDPASGDPSFPISAVLQVRFDRPINPSTLHAGTVRLTDASTGAAIPISIAYDAPTQVLTVTPPPAGTSGYAIGNDYTLTLAGGANGVSSEDPLLPNRFPIDVEIDFTTGPADTTAPSLIFRFPPDGATGVPLNAIVLGVFDDAVVPATLNPSTVVLRSGARQIPGVVRFDYLTRAVTFEPAAPLEPTTVHTMSILGVEDLSGNAGNFAWSFTTSLAIDLSALAVVGINPANNATGVLASTPIEISFSKTVDPATLSGITLTQTGAGTRVAGTITFNALTQTATFLPSAVLNGQTVYEVTVVGVRDLLGNTLAAPFLSRFTTARQLFADNFESGTGKWTLPYSSAGLAWSVVTNSYRSATHSLTDSAGRKYPAGTTSVAELRYPIAVNGLSFVTVQLALRLRAEKKRDFFYVDYRLDGGAWVTLHRPGTNDGWSGSGPWSTVTLGVPTGGASALELRFRLVTSANRNFDGAYVDDVMVQAP